MCPYNLIQLFLAIVKMLGTVYTGFQYHSCYGQSYGLYDNKRLLHYVVLPPVCCKPFSIFSRTQKKATVQPL